MTMMIMRTLPCVKTRITRRPRLVASLFVLWKLKFLSEDLGVRNEQLQELRVRQYRVVRRRDPLFVPDGLQQLAVFDRDNVDVLPAAIIRI